MKNDLEALFDNMHFKYISVILGGIIIILAAVSVGNSQKLLDYVNAGVALTSLTLAIFAIWMTAKSGEKNDVNIANLRDAIKENKTSSSELNMSTEKINEGLNNINSIIERLSSRIEDSSEKIIKYSETIDARMMNDVGELQKKSKNEEAEEEKFSQNVIENFIKNTSVNGLILVYAFCKIAEKKKYFSCSEFSAGSDEIDKKYMLGFGVAVFSMKLFLAQNTKESQFQIINTYNIDAEKIRSTIYIKVEKIEKDKDYAGAQLVRVNKVLTHADGYVARAPSRIGEEGEQDSGMEKT